MRDTLRSVGMPDHVALAYGAWAPVHDDGKVHDAEKAEWLSDVASISVSRDYYRSFERWKKSFSATGDRVFYLELASRLLVGHGNSSATDVGITVHHTWGVPVIPGPALKGLLAHYVDAVYGPSDATRDPWEQQGDEQARADYQGVTWRGRRIQRGPGAVYRALFGAPDAEDDDRMRERGLAAGASAGLVAFHDALYVPGSAPEDRPFAIDVLTVHQKHYYDHSGEAWPNDYDSPRPVAFLTVCPRVQFLFALSGPADWIDLAEQLLRAALEEWAIGGKTSAGYGRLVALGRSGQAITPTLASTRPAARDIVEVTLLEERTKKGGWKAKHEPSGLVGHIQNSSDVPATAKPGDQLKLVVASAGGPELSFRFTTETAAPPSGKKDKSRKKGRK